MNKAVVTGCGILLMAVIVGCGGGSEEDKVMKEMIALQREMVETLEKSKGDPTAALGALKNMGKMAELAKKIESWPAAKQEEMKKKYKAEMDALEERAKKVKG